MSSDPADLANLRDLALPPPVSWWPVQPGWWVLAAGTAVALAIAMLQAWRRHQAAAYRRAADRELMAIERLIGEVDGAALAARISELLKRAALAAYGRETVAGLSGTAWLTFLDRSATTTEFSSDAGHAVSGAIFGTVPLPFGRVQQLAVAAAARRWIRGHRPLPPAG
jgi:hypothetical protein